MTQTILTKLVRSIQDFTYDPSKGSFRAWLRAVTRNACNDVPQLLGQVGSGDTRVNEQLCNVLTRDDLVRDLEQEFQQELLDEATTQVRIRVDKKTWDAFRLLTLDGKTGMEAAGILDMSVTAVYKAKSRVCDMLREEVARLDPPDP
jgi:RNA polymerase sigma-70 factor (ECF subfamily)